MNNNTLSFIYALKRCSNTSKSLRQIAIDYLAEYSMCDPKYIGEFELHRTVLSFFYDYLETADNPVTTIRQFFETKDRWDTYQSLEMGKDSHFNDTDYLLTALMMTQIKQDGKYINGFREPDKEKDNESME